MSIYKYIWHPIKKEQIDISTKKGKKILKRYIARLLGGGFNQNQNFQLNPLYIKTYLRKIFPKCQNYFIPKKGNKKKYLHTYNPDTPCPDEVVKYKNFKELTDKNGKLIKKKWNYKGPYSKKSIIDKEYICKNKKKCKQKYNKTQKCIDCLDKKLLEFEHRLTISDSSERKRYNKKLENAQEMRKYLKKVNEQNSKYL